MIFKALKFVADAHDGQYRKGSNVPYIYHLTNVMKLLCDSDCDEEVITAGILHDVVEDTPVTLEEVKTEFGSRVAELVAAASESSKLGEDNQEDSSWKARKQDSIQFLKETDNSDGLLVACADKLDNSRAILEDYQKIGDELWTRFNAGKEDQEWYYRSLANVFVDRGQEFGNPLKKMAEELKSTVNAIFE